ncbi:MAG: sigma-54 dependent transcriptional regulator [Pseudomonadota bacterium]
MASERILVVDDERSMRDFLEILLKREGYQVETAGSAEHGLRAFTADPHDLVLTDMNLPGMSGLDLLSELKTRAASGARDAPVVLITAYGTASTAVEAMKRGAYDYVMKPFNNDELKLLLRRALEERALKEENLRLKTELKDRYHFESLVGSSPAMQEVYSLVERIKDARINSLIEGESGTGKELVARAIHYSGVRRDSPFVAVNCGAIPETLIESELFGYKKGAFTGAIRDKIGFFEAADKGTIFLDEIGEMPLLTQVKVLRAIQERRVTPVGSTEEREVDVRILAATNRDLETEVKEGRFREDLFYRLNVITLRVPPLRERRADIPELARHFITRFAKEYGKPIEGLTPEASRLLQQYEFPGNVRELENLVERSVALATGPRIGVDLLPAKVRPRSDRSLEDTEGPFPTDGIDLDGRLLSYELFWLNRALEEAGGNKTHAAELLQMSFRSFRYRLQKHGITTD